MRARVTQRVRQIGNAGLAALAQVAWEKLRFSAAIGPGSPRARRFGAFGDGSCLAFPWGSIFGEAFIHIGSQTMIGPQVTISAGMVPGQAMLTNPVVSIGDRCTIGVGSHIVGHLSITIEDDVMTGPYIYVTDQNHGYADPLMPIGMQLPTERPVRIGAGSWIGTGATILPGSDIGRNVVVAAGAVVRGSIPDCSVVAGVPAKVVRQHRPGEGWTPSAPPVHPLADQMNDRIAPAP